MKRRAFLLAGALTPFAVRAQSGRAYRIGLLETASASANRANVEALLHGLKEAGYVEGRNLVIDYRSADGRSDRFAELARDLVRAKPDVIVTRGTPAALAARDAGTVPVVMAAVADPVASKIVASLAHPGGHVTGLATIMNELHGKRLELIKELLPKVRSVGYFVNPDNQNSRNQWKEIEQRAHSIGLESKAYEAANTEALHRALHAAVADRIGALLFAVEALIVANRSSIIEFMARNRIPAVYSAREFVQAGGLISYGAHYPDLYYRAAFLVDKILKGVNAGDLPIEQPTKLELVVNLKTAKALGIPLSREFLARTDEAIE